LTVSAKVTVRYFAAARAAAGLDEEIIGVAVGTTVGTLLNDLGSRHPDLAPVLARCTFLCDGVAVCDRGMTVLDAQTVDVLPPFAG
jgi:molybdopterin synthase sulfur carrier subunit